MANVKITDLASGTTLIGTELFEAIVTRFKAKGVTRVRTLVDRKDHLILSFFRAQGMVAGPSLQLDMDLS